ncbi:MAG: hypothetical protein ACPG7F_05050, partial [Aggregatilineales bacterium]
IFERFTGYLLEGNIYISQQEKSMHSPDFDVELKWICIKLWKTQPFSSILTTWTVFHYHNPRVANKSTELDYSMYLRKETAYRDKPYIHEIPVNRDEVHARIKRGKQIHIPIIGIHTGFGNDGWMAGIESPYGLIGFGQYKLEWFSDGPAEWEPVVRWFDDMVDFLEVTINSDEQA